MSSLALPFRWKGAGLERISEPEAIARFMEVMARTPPASWRGCREFGFRDRMMTSVSKPDAIRLLADVNTALGQLGLDYRAETIEADTAGLAGSTYTMRLSRLASPETKLTVRVGNAQ